MLGTMQPPVRQPWSPCHTATTPPSLCSLLPSPLQIPPAPRHPCGRLPPSPRPLSPSPPGCQPGKPRPERVVFGAASGDKRRDPQGQQDRRPRRSWKGLTSTAPFQRKPLPDPDISPSQTSHLATRDPGRGSPRTHSFRSTTIPAVINKYVYTDPS
jgi:hypothetical protein